MQPSEGLVITDLALKRICQVSANLEEILGITKADALAETLVRLLGPELIQQLRSRPNNAGASPISASLVRLSVRGIDRGIERRFSARHYVSGHRVVIELELGLELQETDVKDDLGAGPWQSQRSSRIADQNG